VQTGEPIACKMFIIRAESGRLFKVGFGKYRPQQSLLGFEIGVFLCSKINVEN
jgi:hypothetical protein